MLISLTVVHISIYIYIYIYIFIVKTSNLHLKYRQFLFINRASIKLGKREMIF